MTSRISIGTFGAVLGIMTIMPNFMLSDDGAPTSQWAAAIGVSASAAFMGGGLIGASANKRIFLLPGLVLQIGAFVVPPILSKFGLIESDKEYFKRQQSFFKKDYGHYFSGTGNPQITFFSDEIIPDKIIPDEIMLNDNKNKVKDDEDK